MKPIEQARGAGPALRHAVIFAWYVPPGLEALGEYYLSLLGEYHADSRLFIGMNHGSDPAWEARFAASGLDAVIRWARPGSGDYWDATGFLTALEAFQANDEAYSLVWFGHTKGGSRAFDAYRWVREDHRRDFWARRDEIAFIFADPTVGFYAPRYNLTPPYPFPGPWPGWRDELAALCRVYRGDCAPLGLCALDTVYVLRGEIVRRFCHEVAPEFFATDLGALGANKWFFEMALPSIAAMQGFEPFIPDDTAAEGDPRDDLMLYRDTAQVHRLARAEVARWRADPTGFQPRILPWDLPAWAPQQLEPQAAPVGPDGKRPAVVFAWFVPEHMPELGEYYLGVLRDYLPDAKLFIGMNHGSDPAWEPRFRAAGLDAEVRWARPELGDYWDTSGFLTALEGFHHCDEAFELVWFGHTKGGSRSDFAQYSDVRHRLLRTFWAQRAVVDRIFDDPKIGIFAPRFAPWPAGFYGDELPALLRIYRGGFAPLGVHARETFFVMRGNVVRPFCAEAGTAFFSAPPGAYGAGRYFFEIGFPNIASMQGYEPFIDPEVAGEGHPRNDGWLRDDARQNHRLVGQQLSAWRSDSTRFVASRMREIFSANDP